MPNKKTDKTGDKPDTANETEGKNPPPDKLEQLTKLREALGLKTTALEGKTSLGDNVSIESAILAYHSLGAIGAEIARSLRAQNVKKVVLLNPPDLAGLHDLRWVEARIEAIRRMFEAVKPKEDQRRALGLETVGTVALAATALVDLYSLFRVEVEVKSADLTLEEAALVSELANELRPETALFYPQILPFDFSSSESQLKKNLEGLFAAQEAAEKGAAAEDENLTTAKAAFQSLRDDLFKADAGTTLLARALRAEPLERLLAPEGSHLLYLKIAKAGGSQKTEHSRLRNKDSVFYSGGAVVTYILFAKDGSIHSSQTLYLHSGFRELAQGEEEELPLSNF